MSKTPAISAVPYAGAKWVSYLSFRDRLREDASARAAYTDLKHRLAQRFPQDRKSYTAGKDSFIARLLAGDDPSSG